MNDAERLLFNLYCASLQSRFSLTHCPTPNQPTKPLTGTQRQAKAQELRNIATVVSRIDESTACDVQTSDYSTTALLQFVFRPMLEKTDLAAFLAATNVDPEPLGHIGEFNIFKLAGTTGNKLRNLESDDDVIVAFHGSRMESWFDILLNGFDCECELRDGAKKRRFLKKHFLTVDRCSDESLFGTGVPLLIDARHCSIVFRCLFLVGAVGGCQFRPARNQSARRRCAKDRGVRAHSQGRCRVGTRSSSRQAVAAAGHRRFGRTKHSSS